MKATFGCLILAAVLTGCCTALSAPLEGTGMREPGSMAAIPFRLLDQGSYAAAAGDDPRRSPPIVHVARSADEASNLWSSMIGPQPMPKVDFSRESVIFLLLGVRSTGGSEVTPQSVVAEGETVDVTTEARSPSAGDVVSQAFSAPYAVITVEKAGVRSVRWLQAGGELVARSDAQ